MSTLKVSIYRSYCHRHTALQTAPAKWKSYNDSESAAMARRSIQSAALDKGATGDNLVSQINSLEKLGVITKDLKEWATVVRWVGNDAAHPNKDDVHEEDADDILKLAEQFPEVIYVTPAPAQERRKERGK